MRLDEIPQTIQRALGFHEALRRVGFRASDIFLRLHESVLSVAVVQGGTAFVVDEAGPYEGDEQALTAEWSRVAEAVNSRQLSDDDMYACLCLAVPKDAGAEFMMRLLSGGLQMPNRMAN